MREHHVQGANRIHPPHTPYTLQLGELPLLGRLRTVKVTDTSAFKKGQEMVDDLKEKYETSDHPMVHKARAPG
jgi:hypothetical protein